MSGIDRAPLHAPADGLAGGNGVYHYGRERASRPDSWNATNYWVDAAFEQLPARRTPAPPRVSSTSPAAGAAGVPPSSDVTATLRRGARAD